MMFQTLEDLKIMPWSWWRTFAVNLGLSVVNGAFGWVYGWWLSWWCSGVSFTIAVTHLVTWSIFFAPVERWQQHRLKELREKYEERGLTWPE